MIGRMTGEGRRARWVAASAWGFLLAPMACAGLLLSWPRSVEPELLPVLALDGEQVAAIVARDAADAKGAPRGGVADELRQLLAAQGEAEVRGTEDAEVYADRRALMARRCKALVADAGEPAARALRAEAVQQLEAALDGRLPLEQARVVLGVMPMVLAREGAAHDGTLIAPHFVLRTLFKTRFNLLFGRKPEHDLAPVERRAFFGYQALHAERLPIVRRVEALKQYARAGGTRSDEALGVLLYRGGQLPEAAEVLHSVGERGGELRARNYAQAAALSARQARE